jgi:methylmalonyl-CoA mutase
MTMIPDFTTIDLASNAAPKAAAAPLPATSLWETPEGIAVKPVYTAADTAGLDFLDTMPGIAPFLRPTTYSL